jgi:hypothetical protein
MPDTPYALGRHAHHDERSKSFRVRLAPKPKFVSWRLYGSVVDQGPVGSCTGHALANVLNHKPFHKLGRHYNHDQAFDWYKRATVLDNVPGEWPTDTGSTGIAVCKAGIESGDLISYQWAFGFDELLRRLPISPVMVGTEWLDGMFHPDRNAVLSVSGPVAGGHEYVIAGFNPSNNLLRLVNSWGTGWGRNGHAYVDADAYRTLIDDGGDCTVPVPRA